MLTGLISRDPFAQEKVGQGGGEALSTQWLTDDKSNLTDLSEAIGSDNYDEVETQKRISASAAELVDCWLTRKHD